MCLHARRISAESTKAMTGAARKDTGMRFSDLCPEMITKASRAPQKAYMTDPVTEKNFRVSSVIKVAMMQIRRCLQSTVICPKQPDIPASMSPCMLKAAAPRRNNATMVLNQTLFKAHVGTYIPNSVGYSLVKNHRAATHRNNMRHVAVIYIVLLMAITASWSATFSAALDRSSM